MRSSIALDSFSKLATSSSYDLSALLDLWSELLSLSAQTPSPLVAKWGLSFSDDEVGVTASYGRRNPRANFDGRRTIRDGIADYHYLWVLMVVCPFGFGVARAALISFLLLVFSKHAAFEGHFYPKQDGREIEAGRRQTGMSWCHLGACPMIGWLGTNQFLTSFTDSYIHKIRPTYVGSMLSTSITCTWSEWRRTLMSSQCSISMSIQMNSCKRYRPYILHYLAKASTRARKGWLLALHHGGGRQ